MTHYDWEFVKDGYVITEDIYLTDDTSLEEIEANTVDCEELCKRLTNQEEYIQELENKLNHQAFELYKYGVVSFEKAVELSNMYYQDFVKYCKDNGYPVELRL